jgi:hypothetical protein
MTLAFAPRHLPGQKAADSADIPACAANSREIVTMPAFCDYRSDGLSDSQQRQMLATSTQEKPK